MPIDPNIPLRLTQPTWGQSIRQGINTYHQMKQQKAADERQNALLQMQQEKFDLEKADVERKGNLKYTAEFAQRVMPNLGNQQNTEQAIMQELQRVGKDSPNVQPLVQLLNVNRQNPELAKTLSLQSIEQARHENLIYDPERFSRERAVKGSEFERLEHKKNTSGLSTGEQKRYDVLSGLGMRRSEEESLGFRRDKQEEEFTFKLRKEAGEGTKHFSTMETNISDAIAAINSGDNALSDTLLAQVLSQVNDTDIRALQMFQQFDKSYGNVAERTMNSINRFISGDRSESETSMIKETLENFRDSHVRPGINKLKTQYRSMAKEEGYDPFKVVPPTSPEDIRDYQGAGREEKLRLLKLYFPNYFKRKNDAVR